MRKILCRTALFSIITVLSCSTAQKEETICISPKDDALFMEKIVPSLFDYLSKRKSLKKNIVILDMVNRSSKKFSPSCLSKKLANGMRKNDVNIMTKSEERAYRDKQNQLVKEGKIKYSKLRVSDYIIFGTVFDRARFIDRKRVTYTVISLKMRDLRGRIVWRESVELLQ